MTASPVSASDHPNAYAWYRAPLRVLAWSGAVITSALVGLIVMLGIALAVAYPNLPEISSLTDYRPKLPLRVFSSDGALLGEFGDERRSFLPISQTPKVVRDAVLAIEDARFYEHGGVDYIGMARAALAQFNEARSQGASTITMQVARNFYLTTEKTFTRKIYEVLLTWKIESQLTKDQILEAYMNQIYLGQRAYGFAAASEIYFGKPLSKVSIAEAAMLAGLPKAPSAYNPIVNPKRATTRQRHIIDRMLDNRFITAEEAAAARDEKLLYRTPSDVSPQAEFVAETARQLVFAQYGEATYSRGLNVVLTVSSTDQLVAYRALRKGLLDFDMRQAYRGPEAFVDLPNDAASVDTRVAEALAEHPDSDELKSAVVVEASPRKVVAMRQNGEAITVTGEGLRIAGASLSGKAAANRQMRRGAVIRLLKNSKGAWSVVQIPEVEGAFIALNPQTGSIKSLIGGFDHRQSKFNHVTQAWRQPGSTFKPFIYSAALEKGFTAKTYVADSPLFFDAETTGSQPWEPKNYDGIFEGPMTLKRGLARSKNMVSIRVLEAITPAYAQEWITRFGFDADKHPPYLTLALGAGAVTPLQMAAGFAVIANGGFRVAPRLIERVTDSKGRVLLEAPATVLNEASRVIDARNAFVMTEFLREVTRSGTAARAQAALKRQDIFGKTGTTNDSMDAWFVGGHPSVVAAVWIGYDTPRKLGDKETGGGLALPVWIDYMSHVLKGVPAAAAKVPLGVTEVAGDWLYDDHADGSGVRTLGFQWKTKDEGEAPPPAPPSEDEKKDILDLFKN